MSMVEALKRMAGLAGRAGAARSAGLNLATTPAGGYRAFFSLACVAAAALLGAAGVLVADFARSEGPPEGLLEQERRLLAERRALDQQAAQASAAVRGTRATEILDRTALLNELLIRKGVSWTHTFLDLEQVLPPNVRMLTIEPEVAVGDTIWLDMTVSAKAPADFIGFLKALEGSSLFGSPALRGSAPPADGDPTFRYQLSVEYDQQL